MTKPLIEIPTCSKMADLLLKLQDESQPIKALEDLVLINTIRYVIGLQPYTVESWNAMHFPSSSLH
jgi:hypothetical protein